MQIPVFLPPSFVKPPSRAPDVLDAFMAIDNELVDWILHARPTNDDEKAEMRRVLALRTTLDQQVNQLVLARMKLATADLQAQVVRLNAVTAKICETTKTIATVKDVLAAADEVLVIAAQVILVVFGAPVPAAI